MGFERYPLFEIELADLFSKYLLKDNYHIKSTLLQRLIKIIDWKGSSQQKDEQWGVGGGGDVNHTPDYQLHKKNGVEKSVLNRWIIWIIEVLISLPIWYKQFWIKNIVSSCTPILVIRITRAATPVACFYVNIKFKV